MTIAEFIVLLSAWTEGTVAQMESSDTRGLHVFVTGDFDEAAARGDRIAVARAGIIQQIGSVAELYERPVNLFVARAIGTPSINLMNGKIVGDSLRLPFGRMALPPAVLAMRETRHALADVIVGLRPEHFVDVRIARECAGLRILASVLAVESKASEVDAWFVVPAECMSPSVRPTEPMVARFDASSNVRPGEARELVLDSTRMLLFDPSGGWRLTASTPGGLPWIGVTMAPVAAGAALDEGRRCSSRGEGHRSETWEVASSGRSAWSRMEGGR